MTTQDLRFLTAEDVIRLHKYAMLDQGSEPVLRDRGLLESAIAMPRQQFSGLYLHPDVPSMAAAYAFHIASNHPFGDGNKRAATAAMIQFLSDNGWSFEATADEAEPIILALAAGQLEKAQLTDWLSQHVREKPRIELRDFFSRLDPAAFVHAFQAIRPDADGNSQRQFQATCNEVVTAMPFVRDLIDMNRAAVAANDESQRLGTAYMILAFATLYRLAESSGYEW